MVDNTIQVKPRNRSADAAHSISPDPVDPKYRFEEFGGVDDVPGAEHLAGDVSPVEMGFEDVEAPGEIDEGLGFGFEDVDPSELTGDPADEGFFDNVTGPANRFLFGDDFTEGSPTGGGGGYESRADGILDRIGDHFLGLDVDDPLPWWRLGSTVSGGLGGTYVGGKAGLTLGAALTAAFPPAAPAIPLFGAGGAFIGGMTGVGLGSVAPEIALETGEVVGLLEDGTRERLGLSNSEMMTYASNELLLELTTLGILSGVRGTVRGTSQLFTNVSKEQMREATRLAGQGYMLMPVQVGDSRLARGYVTVMGRVPLMGGGGALGVLRGRGIAQEELIQQFVEGVPERLGPLTSWHKLGEAFWKDSQKGLEVFTDRMGKSFEDAFRRSAEAGVSLRGLSAVEEANKIMNELGEATQKFVRETTVMSSQEGDLILREFYNADYGKGVKPVVEFLRNEVLPMQVRRDGQLTGEISQMTHQQADQLLSKIDQELAAIDPASQRFAYSLFARMRDSIRFDMIMNTNNDAGRAIGKELSELDAEWSATLQQVFESSIAQHLGSISRKGIRGRFGAQITPTRTKVSKIAKNIVRDLQSPEEVDSLVKLIGPDTMRQATAQYIQDAINAGYKTLDQSMTGQWNPDTFIKKLGLLDEASEQRKVTEALLQKTGSDVTMQNLDDMAAVMRMMASVEIPNVSTYLARRGSIGGARSILNAVFPGLGVALGSSAGTVASGGGTLLASLIGVGSFIGANQFMFRKLVADPKASQLLRAVIDQETSMVMKANSYWQLTRIMVLGVHELNDTAGNTRTRASLTPGGQGGDEQYSADDYQKAVDDWNDMMRNEMEARGAPQELIDAFTRPEPERKKRGTRGRGQ